MSAVYDNIRNWNSEFERVAKDLGVETACLHAVAATEVGSLRPPPSGMPVIRFEVHCALDRDSSPAMKAVIQLRTTDANGNPISRWDNKAHWYKSDPYANWEQVHTGSQGDEWGALAVAASVNPDVAMQCASYGVGQLMGWHFKTIGCDDVSQMVAQAVRGVPNQFNQWKRFFQKEKGGVLVDAMVAHNWQSFALNYNGPGQVDYYAGALEKNYNIAVEALASGVTEEDHTQVSLDTWTERQQALVTLGYDPGPVDGVCGAKTTAALKQFQADQGLTPDGIWGAKTEKAMQEALAAQPVVP